MEDLVSRVQQVTGLRGSGLRVFGVRPENTLTRRKSASGSPLSALGSAGFRLWPPVMEDRTSISHSQSLSRHLCLSQSLLLSLSISLSNLISHSHSLPSQLSLSFSVSLVRSLGWKRNEEQRRRK
jgi:hypothetical protein